MLTLDAIDVLCLKFIQNSLQKYIYHFLFFRENDSCIKSVKDRLQTLYIFFRVEILYKLSIEYQSYQELTKIDAFEHEIYTYHKFITKDCCITGRANLIFCAVGLR